MPQPSNRRRAIRPVSRPALQQRTSRAAPLGPDEVTLLASVGPVTTPPAETRDDAARQSNDSGLSTTRMQAAENALNVVRSGKFRIVGREPIGRGGAGVVWAATDLALKRELAVKKLHDSKDPSARVRFIDEAQITGQLQHPNIVPVYELALDDGGEPMLVMKRVHGRTLRTVIRDAHKAAKEHERGLLPQDERRLLTAFLKVCDAIAFAHSRRVLHRDLKPENVMVGEFGEVLVMDWGLAKPIDSVEEYISSGRRGVISDRRLGGIDLTTEGYISGTLPYMPPEQASGRGEALDESADVYALGAILYTILTDSPPFVGGSRKSVLEHVVAGAFPKPTERAPGRVPEELEAVVLKAMSKLRNDRYRSVTELAEDVERYLDGKTVSVGHYTVLDLIGKWINNNRGMAAGLALTVLACVVGIVAGLIAINEADVARRDRAIAELRDRERLAREAERQADSERERNDLQFRERVQRGEIDELATELGLALKTRYQQLIDRFNAHVDAYTARGVAEPAAVRMLSADFLDEVAAAFDRLFEEASAHPDQIEILPRHYTDRAVVILMVNRPDQYPDAIRYLEKALESVTTDRSRAQVSVLLGIFHSYVTDTDTALGFFDRAHEWNPNAAEIHLNRAIVLRLAQRYEEAIDFAGRAIDLKDDYADAWGERARSRNHLGDPGAFDDFDKAVELAPHEASHLHNRGMAHLDRYNIEAAYADFKLAVKIQPQNPYGFAGLGRTLGAMERFAESLEHFAISLHLDPSYAMAHAYQGTTYRNMNEPLLAIESYTRCIEMDPTLTDPYYWRAVVYFEQRAFGDAYRDVNIALSRRDDLSFYYLRAKTRLNVREYRFAIDDLNEVIEGGYHLTWEAYANRGIAWHRIGRQDKARADLDAAAELAPEEAREYLAGIRRKILGDE